ncbi:MAG: OadG family protein [Spirochaetia bacterium]|jgi:oxaloacetate decarboxylase (Na+ extruding) subunit gamma|nr:OadG family protein [Spirochaetia bacterium]
MEQGLVLMVTGMAVVFSFLVILVFITKILSAVVTRFFPEKEIPVRAAAPRIVGGSADAEIAAVIAAAAAHAKR